MQVVSEKMALADFDGLRGLVTDETIEKIRDPILAMTEKQRSTLFVDSKDIVKQYVTSIDFTQARGSVFVDIFMVYHVVKDFEKITDEATPVEFVKEASKYVSYI